MELDEGFYFQDTADNAMVAVSKDKPTGCPADMGAIAGSRATVPSCGQSGGYAELQVNLDHDICTSERSTLYLWVQLKAASTSCASGGELLWGGFKAPNLPEGQEDTTFINGTKLCAYVPVLVTCRRSCITYLPPSPPSPPSPPIAPEVYSQATLSFQGIDYAQFIQDKDLVTAFLKNLRSEVIAIKALADLGITTADKINAALFSNTDAGQSGRRRGMLASVLPWLTADGVDGDAHHAAQRRGLLANSLGVLVYIGPFSAGVTQAQADTAVGAVTTNGLQLLSNSFKSRYSITDISGAVGSGASPDAAKPGSPSRLAASPPPPARKGSGLPTYVYAAVAAIGGTVAAVAAAAVYVVRSRSRARISPGKDASGSGDAASAAAAAGAGAAVSSSSDAAAAVAADSDDDASPQASVSSAHSTPRVDVFRPTASRFSGPGALSAAAASCTATARLAFTAAAAAVTAQDDCAASDVSTERLSAAGYDAADGPVVTRNTTAEDNGIGSDDSYVVGAPRAEGGPRGAVAVPEHEMLPGTILAANEVSRTRSSAPGAAAIAPLDTTSRLRAVMVVAPGIASPASPMPNSPRGHSLPGIYDPSTLPASPRVSLAGRGAATAALMNALSLGSSMSSSGSARHTLDGTPTSAGRASTRMLLRQFSGLNQPDELPVTQPRASEPGVMPRIAGRFEALAAGRQQHTSANGGAMAASPLSITWRSGSGTPYRSQPSGSASGAETQLGV